MAAAGMKSVFVVVMVVVLVAQSQLITQSQAQTCASNLANMNACAPFMVPGAAAPDASCCGALQAVDHDCLCSTLRIANNMPTQCNLPPLTCGA